MSITMNLDHSVIAKACDKYLDGWDAYYLAEVDKACANLMKPRKGCFGRTLPPLAYSMAGALDYLKEKHDYFMSTYEVIYNRGSRTYREIADLLAAATDENVTNITIDLNTYSLLFPGE